MRTIPLVHSTGRMKSARVILSPGEEIGEHVTENREEILLILRGEGSLVRSGQEIPIREGDVYHVGENTLHNVRNGSSSDLEYVYVVSFCPGLQD